MIKVIVIFILPSLPPPLEQQEMQDLNNYVKCLSCNTSKAYGLASLTVLEAQQDK